MWYLFVSIYAAGYPFATSQVLTFGDEAAALSAASNFKTQLQNAGNTFVRTSVVPSVSPPPPPPPEL